MKCQNASDSKEKHTFKVYSTKLISGPLNKLTVAKLTLKPMLPDVCRRTANN